MMLSAGLATPPGPTHSEAPVSRIPARRPRPARAGFALIAIIVAACGTAATPSPSPTATPAPTPAPTPSPTPLDVSAAFVKAIGAPDFSARATVTGTLTVGSVEGTIAGTGAFDAGSSSLTMTVKAGTFEQGTDTINVGNQSWKRTSPGPWLEDPERTSDEVSFGDLLRKLVSVTDLGAETRGGLRLHHLQPKGGAAVSAATLGFDVGDATDAKFTLDFYAADDGTPAIMAIAGSWTQTSGDVSLPTKVAFDIAFNGVGTPVTISPPTDVWVRYTSTKFGYSMAHPPEWTVESDADGESYLLDGQGYVYVVTAKYTGSSAAFVKALKTSYREQFGVDASSETATTLGGEPAVRLVYEFKNDSDQDVTVADDVISRKGIGWEVFLATGGGRSDIEIFDQFVATFEFTK